MMNTMSHEELFDQTMQLLVRDFGDAIRYCPTFVRWSCESTFVACHVLCGDPTWPDGRPPRPAEIPHLTMEADLYVSFGELTWRCAVCHAEETCTLPAQELTRVLALRAVS